jgi:thymidylate synthase
MISFETLDELYMFAAREVLNSPDTLESRVGMTREVLGFSARLTDVCSNFVFNPERQLDPAYAAAELLWYLSGANDISMISAYAPQYKRMTTGPSDDGVHSWGAYGFRWANDPTFVQELFKLIHSGKLPGLKQERLFDGGKLESSYSQIHLVTLLLHRQPQTRQAIVTAWNSGDLPHAVAGDRGDLPCTLSLQFLLRNGKLNCICTMRSNDIWYGMPYDIFCFTSIQRLMAEWLKVRVGWYQHQVGSLHVYAKHEERLKVLVKEEFGTDTLTYSRGCMGMDAGIQYALTNEEWVRRNKVVSRPALERLGERSMLAQLVVMAGSRWCDTSSHATNSYMKSLIGRRGS